MSYLDDTNRDYDSNDAYTDWVGVQPEGADTSREAYEEAMEAEMAEIIRELGVTW